MELIQVIALVNETGLDDIGSSGLTFPVHQLIAGRIYIQQDCTYWDDRAKQSAPFFVDDNGCSRDISYMVRSGNVELLPNPLKTASNE